MAWLQFRVPALKQAIGRLNRELADEFLPISAGPGAGLVIAGGETNLGYRLGTTEPDLQALILAELRPGATFYDVGANVGFFTLIAARRVGAKGNVVALEPAPGTVARLRRNVEANNFRNVQVVEAAVGGTVGRATLARGSSSLDARLAHAGQVGEDVAMLTLDHGVGVLGWPPPTLIKLDIEGAEVDALRSMLQVVAAHRPTLIIEVHWCKEQVLEQLGRLGYRAEPFGDVNLLELSGEGHGHLVARSLQTSPRAARIST